MITLSAIQRHASLHPHGTAVESPHGLLTWKDYESEVISSIKTLKECVPEKCGVVTLEGETKIDTFITASALASVGIPWVSLQEENIRTKNKQLDILAPHVRIIRGAGGEYGYIRSEKSMGDPSALDEKGYNYSFNSALKDRRSYVSYGFTSGTTGQPKLVLRHESSEFRRNKYLVRRFSFDYSDRYYLTLPMSHASGHGWARTILYAGGTVVIGGRDISSIVNALLNKRITCVLLVPPVLSDVMSYIGEQYGWIRQATDVQFLLTGGRHVDSQTIMNRRDVDW